MFLSLLAATGPQGLGPLGLNPLWIVVIGIATVLTLMIALRLNAFLALIIAALTVAILAGKGPDAIKPVYKALGSTAGDIAIVIAMASIIGKCMLDSGSADKIVASTLKITGKKFAAVGMLFCGFLLGIPVFFDTVFFLLVPLARSLYRQTGKGYITFVMAICAGGAATHTLVPPTPGPLLVANQLGIDTGMMILVGLLVAAPTAAISLGVCFFLDRINSVPTSVRESLDQSTQVDDKLVRQVPLWLACLPILLPVLLISMATIVTSYADAEDRAKLKQDQIRDFPALVAAFQLGDRPEQRALAALQALPRFPAEAKALLAQQAGTSPKSDWTDAEKTTLIDGINNSLLDRSWYSEDKFLGVKLSDAAKGLLTEDRARLQRGDLRRLNRLLLESVAGDSIQPHAWDSPRRQWANRVSLFGSAHFALLLSALIAMATTAWARKLTLKQLARDTELGLVDAGVIILITAAGGAFGLMLRDSGVKDAMNELFAIGTAKGPMLLLMAWAIAAILKVAQGSSTVAMIVGSSVVAAMLPSLEPQALGFHPAYLGTAIGGGSLVGSWMNDSGFWVVAKMSDMSDGQTLRTWTPLLASLGALALLFSILFSTIMPLV
jgi:gluconate:H+ symporter, GntP family